MHRRTALWLFLVSVFCSACASSPVLEESWRDRSVTRYQPEKLLALALCNEESFRRIAEDELVRCLAPQPATPGYELASTAEVSNAEKVRAKARAAGFDAALVLRVLEVERTQEYVPGSYTPQYLRFSDCRTHPFFWATRFDQGQLRTNKTIRVELDLYELEQDKLLWSGVGSVTNPASNRELVARVSDAAAERLRADGFLQ